MVTLEEFVPKYGRIAYELWLKIESGELAHGAKLPSGSTLASAYHTTEGTVRQALRILSDRDLIKATHGRDTIVTWQRPQERHTDVTT